MNITNLVTKLHDDFNSKELCINQTLAYQFIFNDCVTNVHYQENDMQNQLQLNIEIEDDVIIFVLEIESHENEYYMNCFLRPELYKQLKNTLFSNCETNKTTPYFEALCEAIINHAPITPHSPTEPETPPNPHHDKPVEKPYFNTFVRVPMSENMKEKIFEIYPHELAEQILIFCGTNLTLRFTSEKDKEKNIIAFLNP